MPVTKRILDRRFETANQIRAIKKQKTVTVFITIEQPKLIRNIRV